MSYPKREGNCLGWGIVRGGELSYTHEGLRVSIRVSVVIRQKLEEISARMCKWGPKLTIIRHIPNHPTTFDRNFECEMVFRLG